MPTPNIGGTTSAAIRTSAPIYRYDEIDFANVDISEFNTEGRQPLAYLNYHDKMRNASTKMLIQSKKIELTSHGIPSLDKEGEKEKGFYPTDAEREFIKIPLDPKQKNCMELRKHIAAADEYFGSDEMKKQLFGKRADEFEYNPCIRMPEKQDDKEDDNDDDDEDKPKKKETCK